MTLRILYSAGPGDVMGTYEHWKAGRDDPREVTATYSGQFYTLCREREAEALILAQRPGRRHMKDGSFEIEEYQTPFQNSPVAALFHMGQMIGGLRLARRALRFRADVALVTEGTHWFVLALLRLLGAQVIPDIHCTLWPTGHPPRTWGKRLVARLNGCFWRHIPAATLCISPECERQVRHIANSAALPIIQTRPGFSREFFAAIPAVVHAVRPFTLLYAGRIEIDKGVFDLLAVMQRLHVQAPGRFRCIFCGTGGALEALQRAIDAAGLQDVIHCAGHLNREEMIARITQSHAFVVPTTASFVEGLNRVVIEGALAGRPVIATSICPAVELVPDAVVVVEPGDVSGMVEAALRLERDPAYFASKIPDRRAVEDDFMNPERSWGAGLKRALQMALPSPQAIAGTVNAGSN